MTPVNLRQWADKAEHGDSMVYHTGIAAKGPTCKLAMQLSDEGTVSLVQRRLSDSGPEPFAYIAQRIKRRGRS